MMTDHNVRFWGERIPKEVVSMAKHLKDLDKQIFRQVLKAVVNSLEDKETSMSIADLQNMTLSEEQIIGIISGMNVVLREALRVSPTSVRLKSFEDDLRELRICEEFIADFSSVVFGYGRPTLNASLLKHEPRLPKLEQFRWRVDVAVSTSSLSRALQPTILMQLNLSDGTRHQCEVSLTKFQELRYNIALILKEMNDLEKRSVLKIQDYSN